MPTLAVSSAVPSSPNWHQVLGEIRNRGVNDVLILVCDGLRGLVESVADIWPLAIVQTCVLHLVRNTFRYASKAALVRARPRPEPRRTAADRAAARERFAESAGKWGERYPAIVRLWQNAWAEFVPFLTDNPEIRKVIYSMNAIESLHARLRRWVSARGHFPTEQAAMKAPTSPSAASTLRAEANNDGATDGSPPSTPSPSPSKAESRTQRQVTTPKPSYTVSPTDR